MRVISPLSMSCWRCRFCWGESFAGWVLPDNVAAALGAAVLEVVAPMVLVLLGARVRILNWIFCLRGACVCCNRQTKHVRVCGAVRCVSMAHVWYRFMNIYHDFGMMRLRGVTILFGAVDACACVPLVRNQQRLLPSCQGQNKPAPRGCCALLQRPRDPSEQICKKRNAPRLLRKGSYNVVTAWRPMRGRAWWH